VILAHSHNVVSNGVSYSLAWLDTRVLVGCITIGSFVTLCVQTAVGIARVRKQSQVQRREKVLSHVSVIVWQILRALVVDALLSLEVFTTSTSRSHGQTGLSVRNIMLTCVIVRPIIYHTSTDTRIDFMCTGIRRRARPRLLDLQRYQVPGCFPPWHHCSACGVLLLPVSRCLASMYICPTATRRLPGITLVDKSCIGRFLRCHSAIAGAFSIHTGGSRSKQ
jgi:hypothetical protein